MEWVVIFFAIIGVAATGVGIAAWLVDDPRKDPGANAPSDPPEFDYYGEMIKLKQEMWAREAEQMRQREYVRNHGICE